MNSFPTGIKDLDLQLLSEIENDEDFLNTLSLATKNKTILRYLNTEDLWKKRFLKKYPGDFELVENILENSQSEKKWKDFYLSLVRYSDLAEGDSEKAVWFAAKDGNKALVQYLVSRIPYGFNSWNYMMSGAAQGGHRGIVRFFISKGAWDWNLGMYAAAKGGHLDLVKFFIRRGANDWNWGIRGAAEGGRLDLVNFFIAQGADDWDAGMVAAAKGGHRDLVDLFILKGADLWSMGKSAAEKDGHQDLVQFFNTKMKKVPRQRRK